MKTLYNAKVHPKAVRDLARKGHTDEEMARALGIRKTAFYEWQKRHADFAEAVKEGKRKPNAEVEAALFTLATGYEATETQVERRRVKGKDVGAETVRVVRKRIAPHPTAVIFFLKNRLPKRWRDVKDARLSGSVALPGGDLSRLSDAELKTFGALLAKAGVDEADAGARRTR
jgi:hypothetical protein